MLPQKFPHGKIYSVIWRLRDTFPNQHIYRLRIKRKSRIECNRLSIQIQNTSNQGERFSVLQRNLTDVRILYIFITDMMLNLTPLLQNFVSISKGSLRYLLCFGLVHSFQMSNFLSKLGVFAAFHG